MNLGVACGEFRENRLPTLLALKDFRTLMNCG